MSLFKNKKSSTSDQLDISVKIESPKIWIIWVIIFIILSGFIIWSIVGTMRSHIEGEGIILPIPLTIDDISSNGEGVVKELRIKIGDKVKKDQIVAVVETKDLKEKINKARAYLEKIKMKNKKSNTMIDKQFNFLKIYSDKYVKAMDVRIINSTKHEDFLKQFLIKADKLLKHGAISAVEYEDYISSFYAIQNSILEVKSQKASWSLMKERYFLDNFSKQLDLELELFDAESELKLLLYQQDRIKYIKSPSAGLINQIRILPGTYVNFGECLATIVQKDNSGNNAIAFFSPFMGKRIKKNMPAFISPATAQKELYGTIEGKVLSTTEYPLDLKTLTSILKNQNLAEMFFKNGPPIMCKVNLKEDKNTISGYKWTSHKGTDFKIRTGTLCNVKVVIKEYKPISLVMPFLKTLFGETE